MDDAARHGGRLAPNNLEAYWMPFTANRQFKAQPRLLVAAEGMHYTTADGRQVLDGTAGLWCVNAGHGRREIADAVHRQALTLDYAPAFQMGHPAAFEAASRLAALLPRRSRPRVLLQFRLGGGRHRAQDRASPITACAARGSARASSAASAAITASASAASRSAASRSTASYFGSLLPGVDHLPHTYDRAQAGLLARPAGMGRASRRRARAHRRAARSPRPSPP